MPDKIAGTDILIYYNQVLPLAVGLLAITESIKRLAQKGQVEQVAFGIQQRQDMIDQLKVIEKKWAPMLKIHKDISPLICSGNKNGIQYCVKRIRKIIEKVKQLDLEIRTLVDHEQKRVAGELKKISGSHAIIKKYIPSRINAPGYFSLSI